MFVCIFKFIVVDLIGCGYWCGMFVEVIMVIDVYGKFGSGGEMLLVGILEKELVVIY